VHLQPALAIAGGENLLENLPEAFVLLLNEIHDAK
jgi:hypothetical protein